jgi:ATP-dependent RNA helicase SUPV3L1/SUV3
MRQEPFEPKITAALGPTNTGKTHLAVERMLARSSGVMGLPLRLLAREVYDRVVREKGPSAAALVTGEEKIAPASARYFICTVEAMPQERRTAFVGVDEIQLAEDPERGHVFTERLLNARGTEETMLLGAETMRPLVRALVPRAEHDRRERFSTLTHVGPVKLTRLPRRSAIVAFSTEEVYAIAELMRRHRGGAAVVMGALSPRTRNAQVELFQSGEVDFIVATDAIGMGLNLQVDHVAFASLSKFDGSRRRPLTPAEIGQIAGRAGRFRQDGGFGTTGDSKPIPEDTVERVEAHEFEPVQSIQWRNAALDFSSVASLQASLAAPSPHPALRRTREAVDEIALAALAHDPEIAPELRRPDAVRRLWAACQLPDFRRATVDQHIRLIGRVARGLLGPEGRLPESWIAAETEKLDRTDGEVDALAARLAHIRTWTYAANRGDWLADAERWRDVTRAIEDRLSDALHERLTQRFVDRRSSAILRGLRLKSDLAAAVNDRGEIVVEGHYVGQLRGLSFHADKTGDRIDAKALANAAARAVKPEIDRRLGALARSDDEAFRLDDDGRVHWRAEAVARLAPGPHELTPTIVLLGGDLGAAPARERAVRRIEAWLAAAIARDLAPLEALRAAERDGGLKGLARGLAHRLVEGLGSLDRASHEDMIAALSPAERRTVRALGVRIGEISVYVPTLLKPRPARLLALLHAAGPRGGGQRPFLPQAGRTSLPAAEHRPAAAYAAAGYRRCGPLAVRLDMLERLADALRDARQKAGPEPFAVPAETATLLGSSREDLARVMRALGYRPAKISSPPAAPAEGEPTPDAMPAVTPAAPSSEDVEVWRPPRPRRAHPPRETAPPADASSPFAALAGLHATPAARKTPRRRRARRS